MSALANPDPLKESGTSARRGYMCNGQTGIADIKLEEGREGLTCDIGPASKSKRKKNKKKGAGGGGAKGDETVNVNGDHEKRDAEDEDKAVNEEKHAVCHDLYPATTTLAGALGRPNVDTFLETRCACE